MAKKIRARIRQTVNTANVHNQGMTFRSYSWKDEKAQISLDVGKQIINMIVLPIN